MVAGAQCACMETITQNDTIFVEDIQEERRPLRDAWTNEPFDVATSMTGAELAQAYR